MLNRTLCLAVAVVVGAALVITVTVLAGDVRARHRPGPWVLGVTQALMVVAYIGYSRRRLTTSDTVVTMILATTGLISASSLGLAGSPSVSVETLRILPVQALQVQLVSAAILFRRRRWSVVAMVLTVVGVVWLTSVPFPSSPGIGVDDCLPAVGFALSAMILIRALRNAAWDAARLAERRCKVRASVVANSSVQVADDEGRRLVHDRVLGALAAIEAGRDADVVAEVCGVALRELTLLDQTTSAGSLREALAAKEHPHVRIGGDGWLMAPPPRVITALRESAGEAIRNADRHSGVDEVSVDLTSTRVGQVAVVVSDTGKGFDPSRTPGFGLSESIVARMAQVGGEARIESSPGMGTTVRLLWPHQSSFRVPAQSGVLEPGGRSGLYVSVMLPAVLAMLYMAYRHASVSTYPVASVVLAVLLTAVMLTCAYSVGRGRPSWLFISAVAIFNTAITLAVLSMQPAHELLSMEAWVVTGCSIVIGSMSLEARPGRAAFLALAEVMAILAFTFNSPYLGAFEPVGALIMPVACALMSYAVGALLRHGSRLVAAQAALTNAEMDELGWVESAQAARRRYAEQLKVNVAPFLSFCASERPRPSAVLKTRATALAAQCRDLLASSDTMPPAVREALLATRRRGVRVAIRDATTVSPVAWALLSATLAHASDVDAVTLIPARPGTPARVTVIPRLGQVAQADILDDLRAHTIWTEHTDVTTSFIVVAPEWGTSASVADDLGSTT